MQGLTKWQAKQGTSEKPYDHQGPIFTEAARFSLLLDGIKLIGTGNGAGAFASVAALYYFSSRPEVHLLIKVAGIFFVVGLLIFALAVGAYVLGLSAATRIVDQYIPVADAAKIPDQALNSGIDGLMALVFSLFGAVLSWGCFFIGIAIGLYALIQV
jgi:hypothetical protein